MPSFIPPAATSAPEPASGRARWLRVSVALVLGVLAGMAMWLLSGAPTHVVLAAVFTVAACLQIQPVTLKQGPPPRSWPVLWSTASRETERGEDR